MPIIRKRAVLAVTAAVLAGAVTFGLVWFQPWKLWVDHRVADALPAVATATTAVAPPVPSGPATRTASAPADRLLARGKLISQEHPTHGTVSVIARADGSRVLAIAGLSTSEGPDVKVWLTDAPVRADSSGWHVFDDGRYVSLGRLKGNLGNQLYPIPAGTDLTGLASVSIWCDRFDVSFGAAELTPAV